MVGRRRLAPATAGRLQRSLVYNDFIHKEAKAAGLDVVVQDGTRSAADLCGEVLSRLELGEERHE